MLQPYNRIRLSVSAVNQMEVNSLIRNRIIISILLFIIIISLFTLGKKSLFTIKYKYYIIISKIILENHSEQLDLLKPRYILVEKCFSFYKYYTFRFCRYALWYQLFFQNFVFFQYVILFQFFHSTCTVIITASHC